MSLLKEHFSNFHSDFHVWVGRLAYQRSVNNIPTFLHCCSQVYSTSAIHWHILTSGDGGTYHTGFISFSSPKGNHWQLWLWLCWEILFNQPKWLSTVSQENYILTSRWAYMSHNWENATEWGSSLRLRLLSLSSSVCQVRHKRNEI